MLGVSATSVVTEFVLSRVSMQMLRGNCMVNAGEQVNEEIASDGYRGFRLSAMVAARRNSQLQLRA
jgi:hypothetical protein